MSDEATQLGLHSLQAERNVHLATMQDVLRPFLVEPPTVFLPEGCDRQARLTSSPREAPVMSLRETVTLCVSPFAGRRATLLFRAVDRPWDGDAHVGLAHAYVYPSPLPCDGAAVEKGIGASRQSALKTVSRTGGPYAEPGSYILGEDAVPFTGLLCSLADAGLQPLPPRRALLDTTWSLKWVMRPLLSDFVKLRPQRGQKLNHFPGTWRVGRKDALHRSLCRAAARWRDHRVKHQPCGEDDGSDSVLSPRTEDFGSGLYPEAWLLPEERTACLAALRDRRNANKLFIVKPTTSACGRGISLLYGGPDAQPPSSVTTTVPAAVAQSAPRKCLLAGGSSSSGGAWQTAGTSAMPQLRSTPTLLVQRYVDDPYLVHGYKFDLRLYVVVTSYAPMRLYLYREGLVRFATSPYYHTTATAEDDTSEDGAAKSGETCRIAAVDNLTAHLTNFTINKKTEDFCTPHNPAATNELGDGGTGAAVHGRESGVQASKWCLAALRTHMQREELDWSGTMRSVHDLLCKVFCAIAPEVRQELTEVAHKMCEQAGSRRVTSDTSQAGPPCSHAGVCPFFEVYGVDVLLRRPDKKAASSKTLRPVIMEVNIMPSLSTHYSPLDQCVKGNFIADLLTLIGLSAPVMPPARRRTPGKMRYGDAFLDALDNVDALEACLTAEEERRRACHFDRLMPTTTSANAYAALLHGGDDDTETTITDLDVVLSKWEAWREQPQQRAQSGVKEG